MTTAGSQLIEEMFVQVAQGSTSSERELTLTGVAPATLYFSDRPHRTVGHLSTREFVDGWVVGDNSFVLDPPNAVLSFVDPVDDLPEDCVVVLSDPVDLGGSIRYTVDVLEGTLPGVTGACTLFIDPLRDLRTVSGRRTGSRGCPGAGTSAGR